jgi:hypothetical protein
MLITTKESEMYKLKFLSRTQKPCEGEGTIPCNRETAVILLKGKMVDEKFIGKEVDKASVTKHFKDPDVPVLGQKFAVEKMLKDKRYTREQRTEIWDAFWNYSSKTDSLRHGAYKAERERIKHNAWWSRLFKRSKRIA